MRNPLLAFNALFVVLAQSLWPPRLLTHRNQARKIEGVRFAPEPYTFVDEKAIGPGNQSIRLPEGKHSVTSQITVSSRFGRTSLSHLGNHICGGEPRTDGSVYPVHGTDPI